MKRKHTKKKSANRKGNEIPYKMYSPIGYMVAQNMMKNTRSL